MSLITIEDFDIKTFTTLALAYLIPYAIITIIWCFLLQKFFDWRPFHFSKYLIANSLHKELNDGVVTLLNILWMVFFFLPFLVIIAFSVHTAFVLKPYTLGISIGIIAIAIMLLVLTVHYYMNLGYNLTRRVKALYFLTFILFFGGYIAIIAMMRPLSWMGSGYLCLMPSLVVYAMCIYLQRRKFTKDSLTRVCDSEENKKKFIDDLEADRFDDWFTGKGKMTWYSSLFVVFISLVCGAAFYAIWRGKEEEEATIGTICASTFVDILIIVSQFQTTDNHNTLILLFMGYVVKMMIVTFSSKYWFVGHGFLFLIFGTYFIVKFLNWFMITLIIKFDKRTSEIPQDVVERQVFESIVSLQPDYKRPLLSETFLSIIALVLLCAASIFEIGYYDSSALRVLPGNITQRDAFISLIVISFVCGCVISVFVSIKNNKYNLTWPMVIVFSAGCLAAGCFIFLFKGLKNATDLRILAFFVFYYIFGTLFEAFIINGNGMKLFKAGGFKEFDNICSLIFLVLDIADAACLIIVPFFLGQDKQLGLDIFFAITTIFMYVAFCVSFLPLDRFTCVSFICCILYFVSLAGLCITIFVETKTYYLCIAIASIYLVLCLLIFAVLWTWYMDWNYTRGPMLIMAIVSFICAAVAAVGYFSFEEYDTFCLIVGIIMFFIFFGSIAYYILTLTDFVITRSVIVLAVLLVVFVLAAIVGLFIELKSFFASFSALLLIAYICSLLILGGLISTTSKTDVLICSDLFIPVRRLFNGVMKQQTLFRVNAFAILILPFVWGMLASSLFKWPQFGSLAISGGIATFAFLIFTFIYDFDSNALSSVEYMKYDAIEFAVNKALVISDNDIGVDELPPKDRDTYEGFLKYNTVRKQGLLEHSKLVSALKAQLYITAEISFERCLEKAKAYCASKKLDLDFLKQKDFTASERKLIFAFGGEIEKADFVANKEREDYLKFVHDQEEARQAKLAESLKQTKKIADKYAKVIGRAIKEKKFVDPEFHPNCKDIKEPKAKLANCDWKRGEEEFKGEFIGRTTPDDLCQGSIGDCYLVSAMSAISISPKTVSDVFERPVKIQETGAACISMHAMGEEIKVMVDSTLPFSKKTGKAKFVKPRDAEKTSWWFTIVEKAYAKQNGSYSAIIGGNSHVALNRLLGGWPENFDLDSLEIKEQVKNGQLWKNMVKWYHQHDYLCCGSNSGKDTDKNAKNIVLGHAYSIHNVVEVKGFKLLQLRNPWGDSEWTGDWSDKSPLWTKYPDVAKELNHTDVDDGLFWISFKDFTLNYSSLYICLNLQSRNWLYHDIKGKFTPGSHDGAKPVTKGPGANLLTQYLVKFRKATKVRLTFEKTGPDTPVWVYGVYNKGQQVKKLYKGMVYKIEAIASNAVLQSFEWDIPQNQIEFPWTFVVCRSQSKAENSWLLRLWVQEEIDPIDEIKPSTEGAPAAKPTAKTVSKPASKPVAKPVAKTVAKPAPKK